MYIMTIQNPGIVRHIHVRYGILRTHGLFRHIQNRRLDIFSQFQTRYSGITQD